MCLGLSRRRLQFRVVHGASDNSRYISLQPSTRLVHRIPEQRQRQYCLFSYIVSN